VVLAVSPVSKTDWVVPPTGDLNGHVFPHHWYVRGRVVDGVRGYYKVCAVPIEDPVGQMPDLTTLKTFV
jgi:hypothetical protein